MKKFIITLAIILLLAAAGFGIYFVFNKNTTATDTNATGGAGTVSTGGLPAASVGSSTPVLASAVWNNLPTSTTIVIGTAKGGVSVKNFYLANPPTDSDGDVVLKQTQNYVIVYNPLDSSFWLGITGSPFATWQNTAEQDFLTTLGISQSDACKLDVTSGVIYSPNNPNDGKSFPLSFCTASGAFQTP
jgi:hypothetical protein